LISNFLRFILYKGEGLPSPFVLFIVLMSNCFAQLGIEGWLHPEPNFLTIEDSSSHLHIYNDTHIGIINFNDSLNISENKQGFKLVNKTSNGLIKFDYNKHHSIAQIIGKDYSSKTSNNYSEIRLGYKSKNGIITSDASVAKYSGINELSPSLLLSTNLRSGMIFSFGRSIKKIPLQLSLSYTDFLYSLNNIYTDHVIDQYRMSFRGENYRIEYTMDDDDWEINPTDSSLSKIDLVYGNNKTISLSGHLSLSNNQKINWSYTGILSDFKLKLLNNSNHPFFKVNKYTNDNYIFSFDYLFNISNYKFNVIYIKKKVDLYISNRTMVTRIDANLTPFFILIPTVNNTSNGELEQEIFAIKLKPIKFVYLTPYIQFGFIRDKYNIVFETQSLNLFGFPTSVYSDKININIIGKDALDLQFGVYIIRNKWSINATFSQHVPLFIYKSSRSGSEEQNPEDPEDPQDYIEYPDLQSILGDIEGNIIYGNNYGGGKFNLSIIRYLDQ